MKYGLVTILTVALAGSVSQSFGEERSSGSDALEEKRRQAPIRGRRLNPMRAEQRERDEAAEWKREREEWHEHHAHDRGRGGKDDDDE
jgi:hypothetical protein